MPVLLLTWLNGIGEMVGGASFKWAITVVMLVPGTRPVSWRPEPLMDHLDNFVCYGRFIRLIELIELEAMVIIMATITQETTTSFIIMVNQFTLAGKTFN